MQQSVYALLTQVLFLFLTVSFSSFLLLFFLNISGIQNNYVLLSKRLNNSFITYLKTKLQTKLNLFTVIDNINSEHVLKFDRVINDTVSTLYCFLDEKGNIVILTKLLDDDILSPCRHLIMKKIKNSIFFTEDRICNIENSNIMTVIDDDIYINLASNFEFISLNGYITDFGSLIENKISISDFTGCCGTITNTIFSIMVGSFSICLSYYIMSLALVYSDKIYWILFLNIIVLIGSFVSTFEANSEKSEYIEVMHTISTLCIFLMIPISIINISSNPTTILLSKIMISLLIIYLTSNGLCLLKYGYIKVDFKNRIFDINRMSTSDSIIGLFLLLTEYGIILNLFLIVGYDLVTMILKN
jgi:hypothetical protein